MAPKPPICSIIQSCICPSIHLLGNHGRHTGPLCSSKIRTEFGRVEGDPVDPPGAQPLNSPTSWGVEEGLCVSQLSCYWDTIPSTHNLKEMFNLAHVLRRFSAWLTGSWQEGMTEMLLSWRPGNRVARSAREESVMEQTQIPRSRPHDLPRHTQKCVPQSPSYS